MASFQDKLLAHQAQQLVRDRHAYTGKTGRFLQYGDQQLLCFSSNDYLNLASHPAVSAAFIDAAKAYGVGSGASQMVTGFRDQQLSLEHELAAFFNVPRAIVFSTGYMANMGVVSALTERSSTIIQDKLCHASFIDAGKVTQAKVLRYAHADMQALERRLSSTSEQALIISEGVFSMDGDIAPLDELIPLANRKAAKVILDDAHGVGVIGETGQGSLQHFGFTANDILCMTGTFGKSFGGFGAYALGAADTMEYILQFSRTSMYTTALPPAVIAAARCALQILRHDTERLTHLKRLIHYFKQTAIEVGLPVLPSDTAIQPLLIGSTQKALAISEMCLHQGILLTAIRPPTVPANTSRLRISLNAAHTYSDIDKLIEVLVSAMNLEIEAC